MKSCSYSPFSCNKTLRFTISNLASNTSFLRTPLRCNGKYQNLSTLVKSNPREMHSYPYPRPALTVDTVIVAEDKSGPSQAKLLLIKRLNPPFKDCWALPGGFVDENESLDVAARRELQEETSVDPSSIIFTQVGAFGEKGRDPRGWTVTVAYAALVPSSELGVKAADDAREAEWFPLSALPPLAFDHALVVGRSLQTLAAQCREKAPTEKVELEAHLRESAEKILPENREV